MYVACAIISLGRSGLGKMGLRKLVRTFFYNPHSFQIKRAYKMYKKLNLLIRDPPDSVAPGPLCLNPALSTYCDYSLSTDYLLPKLMK